MLPKTYLGTAPDGLENIVGREIHSDLLIAGLRAINPRLMVPLPEHYAEWYPLKALGITCLWVGEPGKGKKVCAFRLGAVPEFTLLKGADLVTRGWRAIFNKVIKSRAATLAQIERQFGVVLEADGSDGTCFQCRKTGVKRAEDTPGARLCYTHRWIRDDVSRTDAKRRYLKSMKGKLTQRRTQRAALKEVMDVSLSY